MDTTTTEATADEATTTGRGWARARRTMPGIVLMGMLGALAGFLVARYLWR